MDFGTWQLRQAKEIQEGYKKEEKQEKGLEEESLADEWDSDGDMYGDLYAIPGITLEEASGFVKKEDDDELTSLMRLDDDYDIIDCMQAVGASTYNKRFGEWIDA
jgi:hypothetical protein